MVFLNFTLKFLTIRPMYKQRTRAPTQGTLTLLLFIRWQNAVTVFGSCNNHSGDT